MLLLMAGERETCSALVQNKLCFSCKKTIRTNQRRSKYDGCKNFLHFKWHGEDPETASNELKCYSYLQFFTSPPENGAVSTSDPMIDTEDVQCFEEFKLYVKTRVLKIFL